MGTECRVITRRAAVAETLETIQLTESAWHLSLLYIRAVFDGGGWGVEPPAKISDPPAAIKKTQGGSCTYVPMHKHGRRLQ